MYESAFKDYKPTEILPAGMVENMENKIYKGHVYIKNDFSYPLTNEERELVKVKMKLLKPQKAWDDKKGNPGSCRQSIHLS